MLETQLVAGSEKVKEAALALYEQHEKTVDMGVRLRAAGKDPEEDTEFKDFREVKRTTMFTFLEAAREELGIPLRTSGERQ